MAWITKYSQPVSRLIHLPEGDFVATITDKGFELRGFHRHVSVNASYNDVAYMGLQRLVKRRRPIHKLRPLEALVRLRKRKRRNPGA